MGVGSQARRESLADRDNFAHYARPDKGPRGWQDQATQVESIEHKEQGTQEPRTSFPVREPVREKSQTGGRTGFAKMPPPVLQNAAPGSAPRFAKSLPHR